MPNGANRLEFLKVIRVEGGASLMNVLCNLAV